MNLIKRSTLIAFSLGMVIPALADGACTKVSADGELYQCSMQQKKSAEDELNKQYTSAKNTYRARVWK